MLWILVVILVIVLIVSVSRGGKKKKYEIQKLKKELDEEKTSINLKIKLFNTELNQTAEVKESEWQRMTETNTQGKWVVFDASKHAVSEEKTGSIADELIKLKKLLNEGVLTEEEFQTEKKKLLGN